MASSKGGTNYSRRFFWLAAAIVGVIAAYTAGWFYVAGQVEARTLAFVDRLVAGGNSAECVNPRARGYPFRIGLFCDRVEYVDARGRAEVHAGTLRTAAQVYDPFRVVGELGRVEAAIAASRNARGILVGSDAVRFSARLGSRLPAAASLEGREVSIAGSGEIARADAGEAHMRSNGPDLDLAFRFTKLSLTGAMLGGRAVVLPEGSGDLTVTDGVALAVQRPRSLRGQAGIIRSLALSTGADSGLSVSGPVSVGEDGLVDAELTIEMRNPKAVGGFLAGIFPERRREIETALSGIALLGNSPSLPLTVREGRAQLAFVSLGRIPPLD